MKELRPVTAAITTGLLAAAIFLTPGALAQSAPEWLTKGQQAYAQGKTDEAIIDFRQAMQADGSQTDAAFNLGAVYYNQKQYNNALDAFNQVLIHDPNDQAARFESARTLEKLNRPTDAIAAYSLIPPSSSRYSDAQASAKRLLATMPMTTSSPVAAQPQKATALMTMPNALADDHTVVSSKPITLSPADMASPSSASTTAPQAAMSKPHEALALQPTTPFVPKQTFVEMAIPQEFVGGFAGPTGVAMDNQGNLYVANFSKNNIYRVLPNGEKRIIASGQGINGPVGLSLDHQSGDVYIANHLDNTVSRITPDGKVTVIATGLKGPYNMYLDEAHNTLYVSQQDTNSIAKIILK